METRFRYYLLPLLLLFIFVQSGCTQQVGYSPDPHLPLRVVVVADEQHNDYLHSRAYDQVKRTIGVNLVRGNITVVNSRTGDQVTVTGGDEMNTSGMNLCRKYGTDVVMLVLLDIVEKRVGAEGLCRVTLLLDSWAYDAAGYDLGVSSSKTSVATHGSCIEAVQTAAQALGYRASNVLLGKVTGRGDEAGVDLIIIESGGNASGFD